MQTHGYERSAAWRLALALLDQVRTLTGPIDDDPFGLAGKLRSLASELPTLAALTYEQLDYDNAQAHAERAAAHHFKLWVQAQVAHHLGLITARQLKDLRQALDRLDEALSALPDELFEDDGLDDEAEAAA